MSELILLKPKLSSLTSTVWLFLTLSALYLSVVCIFSYSRNFHRVCDPQHKFTPPCDPLPSSSNSPIPLVCDRPHAFLYEESRLAEEDYVGAFIISAICFVWYRIFNCGGLSTTLKRKHPKVTYIMQVMRLEVGFLFSLSTTLYIGKVNKMDPILVWALAGFAAWTNSCMGLVFSADGLSHFLSVISSFLTTVIDFWISTSRYYHVLGTVALHTIAFFLVLRKLHLQSAKQDQPDIENQRGVNKYYMEVKSNVPVLLLCLSQFVWVLCSFTLWRKGSTQCIMIPNSLYASNANPPSSYFSSSPVSMVSNIYHYPIYFFYDNRLEKVDWVCALLLVIILFVLAIIWGMGRWFTNLKNSHPAHLAMIPIIRLELDFLFSSIMAIYMGKSDFKDPLIVWGIAGFATLLNSLMGYILLDPKRGILHVLSTFFVTMIGFWLAIGTYYPIIVFGVLHIISIFTTLRYS